MEREPGFPSDRFAGVLKSWAYRCKVMEVGSWEGSSPWAAGPAFASLSGVGKGFSVRQGSGLTGACRGDGKGKGLALKVS